MKAAMTEEGSVVAQVAQHVRGLITARALKRGAPLPSYRALSAELGVALRTAKRGMDALAAEGIIRSQRGQGCFVNKELSRAPRDLEHIGLIYPSSRGSLLFYKHYLSEIMQGITAAAPSGGDTHIFSMRDDGLIGAAHLGKWAVDGVLLLEVDNDDYLRTFASWGTPGVVVDYHPGDGVPLDSVSCDNAAAARQVVEHLADLGHRRVVYVGPHARKPVLDPRNLEVTILERDSSDVRERRDASVRALRERDMFAAEICAPTFDSDLAVLVAEFVTQGMRQSDRPTALLTDSEYTTAALLTELQRDGIRVPEDISVCAVAGSGDPAIPAVLPGAYCRFDFFGMGRVAAELLADRCRRPQADKPRARRIGFEFVQGETTRQVKAIKRGKK